MNSQSDPFRVPMLRRILAVAFSFLAPGAGHILLGDNALALKWFAAALTTAAILVVSVTLGSPFLTGISFVAGITIRVAAIANTVRHPKAPATPGNLQTFLMVGLMLAGGELADEARHALIGAHREPTLSMYPNLEAGDRFITSLVSRQPERGDIVVFDFPGAPGKYNVKRVVGLAGDTIEMRNGLLVLNRQSIDSRTGTPCQRAYRKCMIWQESTGSKTYHVAIEAEPSPDSDLRQFGPTVVPRGQVFVLGDARDISEDSRYFGTVPVESIRGKPKFIYWSANESGIHWNRINLKID